MNVNAKIKIVSSGTVNAVTRSQVSKYCPCPIKSIDKYEKMSTISKLKIVINKRAMG